MKKISILFDLLACQSPFSKNRGIGNYTKGLTEALLKHSDVIPHFIYNQNDRDAVEEFVSRNQLSREKPSQLSMPLEWLSRPFDCSLENPEIITQNTILNMAYSMNSCDVVHTSSFMDPFISYDKLPQQKFKSCISYDLIPHIMHDTYLSNSEMKKWYYKTLSHYYDCDLIFTISECSRRDLINFTGINEDKIINIYAAASHLFKPHTSVRPQPLNRIIKESYGIIRKYILFTGGQDPRKNLEGMVRSFSLLPAKIHQEYQLVIVCSIDENYKKHLHNIAHSRGLKTHDVVVTGFVSDLDLAELYRNCSLFVFPSLYEGFGLPLLEAMSCGAPSITSNTSSLIEIMDRKEAWFDPKNDANIATKIYDVITNEDFRNSLRNYGLERSKKFSWQSSASRVIEGWQAIRDARQPSTSKIYSIKRNKPKLAFLSPLPPEQSGIADYSADLLPHLAKYYDIDIYTTCEDVSDPYLTANFNIYHKNLFEERARNYDRILYQMGNSDFHIHMFDLITKWPGVSVIHDAYLGNAYDWAQMHCGMQDAFSKQIYLSKGTIGISKYLNHETREDIVWEEPAHIEVVNHSIGVIAHSNFAKDTILSSINQRTFPSVTTIPLLKRSVPLHSHDSKENAILNICTFGHISHTKLPLLILEGYEKARILSKLTMKLTFVGKLTEGQYGQEIRKRIEASPYKDEIAITGYINSESYTQYLQNADIAIQLRQNTRGETSAAVLDCLSHGVPLIVNDYATFKEYPNDILRKIEENPTAEDISYAIHELASSIVLRNTISEKSQKYIKEIHDPCLIAAKYYRFIENCYESGICIPQTSDVPKLRQIRQNIKETFFNNCNQQKRMIFDITLYSNQHNEGDITGIQNVIKQLKNLFSSKDKFIFDEIVVDHSGTVKPAYVGADGKYRTLDNIQVFTASDNVYILPELRFERCDIVKKMNQNGLDVYTIVYDILPLLHPSYFDIGSDEFFINNYINKVLPYTHKIACISKYSADTIINLTNVKSINLQNNLKIGWFHLGFKEYANTLNEVAQHSVKQFMMDKNPIFLMVGTLYPHKGHEMVLKSFDRLWGDGFKGKICIIGRRGSINAEIYERLRRESDTEGRLLFLEAAPDETLAYVYQHASCLIAASVDEGFGLPLIEAAQYGIPILASDIPVFREVCQGYATYFERTAEGLEKEILNFERDFKEGQVKSSKGMPFLTWEESCKQLEDIFFGDRWYAIYKDGEWVYNDAAL